VSETVFGDDDVEWQAAEQLLLSSPGIPSATTQDEIPMWHPNVYEDGVVCISILHAPGTDEWGYEDAGERWMPVHTVESIVSGCDTLAFT
jgi:hypothetical protein